MQISTVEIRSVRGTEAALGWSGGHSVVIDRPEGRAGGKGLGFNGAQLLALSIGGCFANDLRYVAAEMGVQVNDIIITVDLELDGDPILATGARMKVEVTMQDGSGPSASIDRAKSSSMSMNSLARGLSVRVS